MLFTWDWKNTCVVYKWWHVKTFPQFLFTLVAIVLISAGYEFSKYWFAKWNKKNITYTNNNPNSPIVLNPEESSAVVKWLKSLIYGFQVGYSFMLMLVFMTYNGWYMIATVVGAILGHHFWGQQQSSEYRTMACH